MADKEKGFLESLLDMGESVMDRVEKNAKRNERRWKNEEEIDGETGAKLWKVHNDEGGRKALRTEDEDLAARVTDLLNAEIDKA